MKISFLLLLLTVGTQSYAQNKLYAGPEAGLPWELYETDGKNPQVYTKPFIYRPIWGFCAGYEIMKYITIETGIYRRYYGEGYYFRTAGNLNSGTGNAINTWQIPLLMKAKVGLLPEKIYFNTNAGVSWSINSDYGSSGSTKGKIATKTDSIQFVDTANFSLRRNFFMVGAGISFDFHLSKFLILSTSFNYYMSRRKIVNIDVTYQYNSAPVQTANVFTRGDYCSIVFGLKVPIPLKN
jgi:hypothetical protein